MLQTTNDETLSTQAIKNKKNGDILAGGGNTSSDEIGESIKNLSIVAKLTKFKKLKLIKTKK